MIESITEEQVKLLPIYRDKWLDFGLSTSETDVEESLEAIREIYRQHNVVFPERYEMYDSPFAAAKAMREKYSTDVGANDFCYGAHDASWLSFYDFFLSNFEIHGCEQVIPFIKLAKHCGWVLLYDELVVLTRKPVKVKFDADKRSHCEDGFAIEFRDGTGIAVWHGTLIPSVWVFDKKSITPKIMFGWDNIEQRRSACEIVGWANVVDNLNGTVIDEDEDATIGTLIEVDLPDSGKEKFLIALDPNTNKRVGLPVPREMETALDANSWTYGISKFKFTPDFRV